MDRTGLPRPCGVVLFTGEKYPKARLRYADLRCAAVALRCSPGAALGNSPSCGWLRHPSLASAPGCAARQRKSRVPVIGLAGARSGHCGCRYPPPATWPRREAQKNPVKGPGCLTRMLHEGGPFLTGIGRGNHDLCLCLHHMAAAHFVLFGFRPRRAVHLDRSASTQSYGYASSADRPTCFARHALNSEPFMQPAG